MANKRPAETPTQIYMKENYSELINKLKAHFSSSVPDTSVNSRSDESHILYFDPFLRYFLEIEPQVFVAPVDWASAFIQEDLASTVKYLCRGIMVLDNFQDQERLKGTVQNAALWMMQKWSRNLDPWSYFESSRENLPLPTVQEKEIINSAIDECQRTGQFFSYQNNGVGSMNDLVADASAHTLIDLETNFEVQQEDIYLKVLQGFMNLVKERNYHMNSAQVACALTRSTIPMNTDIFVDAVQISNSRFTIAYGMNSLGDMAGKFATQYIRRDIVQKLPRISFKGIQDMCPVKRLAFYRGVKFIYSVKFGHLIARTTDFSSEILEHNVYPSREERTEIDSGIMKAVQYEIERAGICVPEPDTSNPLYNFQNQVELNQNADLEALAQQASNFDAVNAWVEQLPSPLNCVNQLQSSIYCTPQQVPPANSSNSTLHPCINANHRANINKVIPVVGIEALACAQSPQEFINIEGYPYPKPLWDEVYKTFQSDGSIKAGKKLFHELFSHEEKKHCTVSGKKNTPKLDEKRVNAVLEAIKYLEAAAFPGKSEPWTADRRQVLFTKVIVDTSNQYRRQHRPPE